MFFQNPIIFILLAGLPFSTPLQAHNKKTDAPKNQINKNHPTQFKKQPDTKIQEKSSEPEPIANPSPFCSPLKNKSKGKILEVHWTDKDEIATTVTHVADVGVIVKTTGYQEGDCIKIVIDAEDGKEIITGKKSLSFWGKVDKTGMVKLSNIFQNDTLILQSDDH